MIADHGDVFWRESSVLLRMNKSFHYLVPDIKIVVHPWVWAPMSVVALVVSAWHSCTLEGSVLDLFLLKFESLLLLSLSAQFRSYCNVQFISKSTLTNVSLLLTFLDGI